MSKQENLIRASLESLQEKGLNLQKGILYDWTKPGPDGIPVHAEEPSAYGVCAAIFLFLGKGFRAGKSGWLKELCQELDVDFGWLHRFWMGFDRNYQVMVSEHDKKGNIIAWHKDSVSELGIRFAKEYHK